ncbi:hypothetical protein MCOR27_000365 [Pyricularia oryzae]|uniref:GTP-binding protein Obg/CgtA n=5 Tax=Pyricularia TaxID=48558 RepID=A0ABQ8NR37_PYRGI|nr:GTPase MTG2 [Pyricularia oryzae 70-15]ELQ40017.1 GTPase MTG2 [Pyricularia oryzae Y34]KAH8847387.1 hypothetical protein MCOR01_000820 [Pyricularia oryzae]KAI6300892.1 hypothetical protein MCOR33_003516 [Pyricularia grisea]EHA52137.1 GTPase MTG2 [Pyricularia oryzae 70-15]KAH9428417.1 hypothetical protein MCOR02_010969 [Pyricularia oryzae]
MSPICAKPPQLALPFLYPFLLRASTAQTPRAASPLRQYRYYITETPAADISSRLNPDPDDYSAPHFSDKAKITITAGAGGNGCISFLREAYVEEGPPNGGDGGHGGNVYIQAVHGQTSLHKLARKRSIRAAPGKHGQGSSKTGQKGDDVVIQVPVGTIVREISRLDPETEDRMLEKALYGRRRRPAAPVAPVAEASVEDAAGEELAEEEAPLDPFRHKWLLYPGMNTTERKNLDLPLRLPKRTRYYSQPAAPVLLDLSQPTRRPILLAAGGIGGLGNPHFLSRERPKPMFATKGERPMSMKLELELKLLADVGLVGLPNAGKSTLVRALSNSRARVGAWAFTTLKPNIGTVVLDNNKGKPLVRSVRRVPRHSEDMPYGAAGEDDTEVVPRTRFTVADIPGLIEGAHLDKGLGMAFLRHVERAGVLAFVLDLSAGNAVKALKALWHEVGQYAQMKEDEEKDRERDARIEWSDDGEPKDVSNISGYGSPLSADSPPAPEAVSGLHIASKPWFVVATKADLPSTKENFDELRGYLAKITAGEESHPSGIAGAWIDDCAAIPVSAIKGQGVDRVIHWTVGLLDE